MPRDDPNAWNRPTPDFPHWQPPAGRGVFDAPPADLCRTHRKAWLAWRDHIRKYDPNNPTEWPGGQHIMDSRTSHTTRRRSWIEKNARQMEIVENICRSGKSKECDRAPEPHSKQIETVSLPERNAS